MSLTDQNVTLTGLQEYEEYNFSVAAQTQPGIGPYSVAISVLTFQDSECKYIYLSMKWSYIPHSGVISWSNMFAYGWFWVFAEGKFHGLHILNIT